MRQGGFTLLELLIVIAIIAVLLVLLAPAFTGIKSAGDVTSAAYTIKGVLDTARTYAKANNTYTWVGFYEEDVSQPPATPGVGRIVMEIVASRDGTNVAITNPIPAASLIEVGKLTKIDNVHVAGFRDGSGTGSTFDTRPPVTFNGIQYSLYNFLQIPNAPTTTAFTYPAGSPYTFSTAVQFSPRGEARVNNNNNSLQPAAEIGIQPTHGTTVDTNNPNVAAIQFTGVSGNVVIYRR